jgi:hypothetical protein
MRILSFSFLNFFLSVSMRLRHCDSEKYTAGRPSAAAAMRATSSHSSARMPRRPERTKRSPQASRSAKVEPSVQSGTARAGATSGDDGSS